MSNFMDFLTGGIQSIIPQTVEATAPNVSAGEQPRSARPSGNPFAELFASTEQQYGLPEGYLERTARVESSFNPRAKNPNSSAGGLFQFIDGTAKQYGLADRYDPMQATDAAARLARDNAAILKRTLGRDPTAGELYLAHQQGAGGAVKLLSNPDAPAEAIVGAAAARLNGGAGLTAGQLAQKWTAKIDGAQPASQGGNPALAYAATRGRDPRANMPAPDATQAMGQMPMASRQPPPDLSNSPDGGARDFMLRQAGMAPDMQQSAPQGGGMIERLVGGLGGLGGMRVQQPAPQASEAPAGGAPGGQDIESLVPSFRPHPFGFFGDAAIENRNADIDRQGKIALIRELSALGIDPKRAAGLINTPEGLKLALGQIQQAKVAAADSRAVGLLSGQGGAPAPSSPSASTSVMNDPVMQGAAPTTKAVATDVLRVLADPNASKTMKDAAEKRYAALLEDDKLTSEQKTHLQAKREGFGGGILDMKERLARAGKAETTVNVGGAERSYDQTVGKAYGEKFVELQKAGSDASKALGTIQLMEQLAQDPKFYSGLGGESAVKVNQALVALGVKDANAASGIEAFRALSNQLILDASGGSLGAQISNTDRDFLRDTAPNLANTPAGNKALLDIRRKFVTRQQEVAALARDYANEKGRLDAGFDKVLDDFVKKNPLFPPVETPASGGAPVKAFTKADFDKLPSGARFISPDGKERIKP